MCDGARSGASFAAMHRAYAKLADVLGTAPAHLRLPRYARMRYGAHEVLVEMPAIVGNEASNADILHAGPVLDTVAASIAWLAHNGLVYIDVRGPNVLLDGDGHATLIDFDDCIAVDEPVTTLAAYTGVLAAYADAWRADNPHTLASTFAELFVLGKFADVQNALAAAFDALTGEA